ncbi:hypothetical protein QWY82_18870 [Simiduia curdlanivorans]|uniref:Uncharacterized protein n=1 Tax=Simiduia curdlanivorans TaxID=1492769 RepID=A0ABV8V3U9_9GAMM|nr:hypothetical protein [Simiduia curdlanivorans]MDN3640870.1 hypothetical protein [Simiduia curdlanivorans]
MPEPVETLAISLASAKNLTEASEIYVMFETEAEKLPWPQDNDFGALVLQSACLKAPNIEVKKFMLSKALSRAQWCATCSTSGGEGLARMQHVNELKAELSRCN